MEEVLNERKQKILKAIIKTYMETGEPVGSRRTAPGIMRLIPENFRVVL